MHALNLCMCMKNGYANLRWDILLYVPLVVSLSKAKEESRLTLETKMTRKTQKSVVVNKLPLRRHLFSQFSQWRYSSNLYLIKNQNFVSFRFLLARLSMLLLESHIMSHLIHYAVTSCTRIMHECTSISFWCWLAGKLQNIKLFGASHAAGQSRKVYCNHIRSKIYLLTHSNCD